MTYSTTKQVLAVHPAQMLANIKSHDIKANIKAMWSMPYDADPILEPELMGLSCGQVIIARQIQKAMEGDGTSVDRLMDRMIGKPEQINKNLNLKSTYKEFLEEIAIQEGIIDVNGHVTGSETTSPDKIE